MRNSLRKPPAVFGAKRDARRAVTNKAIEACLPKSFGSHCSPQAGPSVENKASGFNFCSGVFQSCFGPIHFYLSSYFSSLE